MFICVIRIFQQHIVHIFIRKCLQPIWLQSTFNNMNRPPSQCRACGMELLSLIPDMKQYFINNPFKCHYPCERKHDQTHHATVTLSLQLGNLHLFQIPYGVWLETLKIVIEYNAPPPTQSIVSARFCNWLFHDRTNTSNKTCYTLCQLSQVYKWKDKNFHYFLFPLNSSKSMYTYIV